MVMTDNEKEGLVSLVRRAKAGDQEAFSGLYECSCRAVSIDLLRSGIGSHAVEDLVQEVYIQAWLKLSQLHDNACFISWVRTIAWRLLINSVKRQKILLELTWTREQMLTDPIVPADVLMDQEQAEVIRSGMLRLSDVDRDTLIAFYFRGRRIKEMSSEFVSPVGTIKRRLHDARKRLGKQIADHVDV